MKKLDLVGQTINGVLVISFAGVSKHEKTIIRCKCLCGKEFECLASELKNGHTRSCGCYSQSGTFSRKHGQRSITKGSNKQSTLYTFWINMKMRCKNDPDYANRGISVYPTWKESFETFFADISREIGERPPNPENFFGKRYWSIDRTNNDGNYEPGNMRWATPIQQKLNQRPRRYWKKPEGTEVETIPSS